MVLVTPGISIACINGLGYLKNIPLRKVVDLDARFHDQTPVQAAAAKGHLEIVNLLLAAKADVDLRAYYSSRDTALQTAAAEGQLDIVDKLLEAKADVNAWPGFLSRDTALQAAAVKGHIEVVERLRRAKADFDALPQFSYADFQNTFTTFSNIAVLHRLMALKSDVQALAQSGFTPLQVATMKGYFESAERV